MRSIHRILAVGVIALTACGKKPEAVQVPAVDTVAKGGMPMAMQGMQMMPMMTAHLDSVGGMAPAQLAAMMTAHQDLASRMMDAMGADMRGMNMAPDAAWTALGDSVRQDLAELPSLSGGALQSRMQAHLGRMRRMMTTHRMMMKM